jgi:hypothetical protein
MTVVATQNQVKQITIQQIVVMEVMIMIVMDQKQNKIHILAQLRTLLHM